MYNVLLADDENIILEGISRIVDWEASGTRLSAIARNGQEALQSIHESPPDIVISDIRMPGMDGIELVRQTLAAYPGIRFILLTGYSEFDYAQQAMKHGVKHYLLKPCNEKQISQALDELVEELRQQDSREQFLDHIKARMKKMLPYVKEQFLKEFVTNKTYGRQDWEYYRRLFDFGEEPSNVRLVLVQLEKPHEFEHLFAFKNIAEDILSPSLLMLSSTIGDNMLFMVRDAGKSALLSQLQQIRETFLTYYKIDCTIALSEVGEISESRQLYKSTLECLRHRFYVGEGSLITTEDIRFPGLPVRKEELAFDDEPLLMAVRSGDWEQACAELERFFQELSELMPDESAVKSYGMQLCFGLIRQGSADKQADYLRQLAQMQQMDTIVQLREQITELTRALTASMFELNRSRHSAVISKMLDIIHCNLGNPELQLNWIAQEMMYMNPDYLGKLFKKEVGEKFSNYVMKARIERAKELICSVHDMKIFELADQLGFGENPQYFSQVFKKYTGHSPSEYGRLAGGERPEF
ncbi:response regulator transcription factor [Paenibacillus sp. SYP-B4298]|uniref:response regulator transcription factor n=1 Tax=Paenibacillus sp. SYP-B4298 TaxID=2996034 RepID=UPI0022DD93C1|nr:response regulator [Paenibacillus sp. SYP-B4298]